MITRKFDSSSSSAVYTAQFDPATGKGTCNCPGWTKRVAADGSRACKHTKELAARTETLAAEAMFAGAPEPRATTATQARLTTAGPGVKPMLASAMKEGVTLEDFGDGWALEEKFDGHRLLVVVGSTVTAWSRPGAEKPAQLRKLPEALEADLAALPYGTYDGELYVPGGTSSDVVRLDRRAELRFAIFDAVELMGKSIADQPLSMRRAALALAVLHLPAGARAYLAEQLPVSSQAITAIWKRGGEGAILKRLAATYQPGKRTPDWVKVKAIGAAELTLTGFGEGKMGPQSVMLLRHDDGRETTVKVLGNDWLRIFTVAMAYDGAKKYIGRRVVISFMGMTPGNQWRHPQFDHFVEEA